MSDQPPPLAGLTALVTGASRGIGRAVALGLAQQGAHVIAVARTQGALEALDDAILATTGAPATLVPLDLKAPDGIDTLGGAIYERWGKLDILVSAAGFLGGLTPAPHMEPRQWEQTMAVNLTAGWRLIRSMDPLLRRAEAGRAVFLTSGVARKPRAFWGAYAASKAGLEALVGCYAEEVGHTPVRCVLLNPGAMRTQMRAAAYPGEEPESLPDPSEIVPLMVELVRPDQEPLVDARDGVIGFRDWKAGSSSRPSSAA